jgi:hypothetical protein
MTVL